jgi:hypothetical protein
MRLFSPLFLACLLLATRPLPAQDTTRAAPGDSIHFMAWKISPLFAVHGTLVAVRDDSLFFVRAGADTSVHGVPFDGVSDFYVNHGNRPPQRDVGRYALKGTMYGGISGFMLGGFFAWCTEGFTCNGSTNQKAAMLFGGLAIGAAAGALVGTTIGLVHDRPSYEKVKLSSLGTIALIPTWDPATRARGLMVRIGY